MTHRSGNTEQLQKIYIRGSQVRFMILPDMLKNAPMLRKQRSGAAGRGKAAILKAQVRGRGRPMHGGGDRDRSR